MPCWRKHASTLLVALFCMLASLSTQAGSILPRQVALVADPDGQALNAEFVIELGSRLEEAVNRGIPLHFRLEFTLDRKRWYWADEHIASRILEYKLAYQTLTRQYRLSVGGLHQNFSTLEEALRALGRVGRMHVVDRTALQTGETYRAAVRLSLDHGQLPKPLQLDALADRDWQLSTRTEHWEFTVSP